MGSFQGKGYEFASFRFFPDSGELHDRGRIIRCPAQTALVLDALLLHVGQVVSREQLCAELWPEGDSLSYDDAINKAVSYLRYELRDNARTPKFIQTLPKRGYRFVAEVRQIEPDAREQYIDAYTFAPSKFYILGTQQITASKSTSLGTNFFVQVQVAGASGAGVPTGTVSFSTNGNTYGPFTLDTTGSIYIPCGPSTVCDLPIGTYTFTAKYSGDKSFNPSTTTFPFTITKRKINYSALLSSQTPPVNSTIIATAYSNFDPAVVPTGTVTLTRDDTGAVLATGQIGSNGTAVIPFVAAAGDYDVIPSWPGDSNYTAGIVTSYDELIPVATGTVNTTTAMAVSSKTATLGGRTQIVITVTPQSVVTGTSGPSGTVTIRTSNGEQAQPVTIVGGQANTYLSWTTAGPTSIYATYNGDTNYNGSGTALTTITVAQATPTLQLQARSSYVAVGSQTSVTASLTSALIGGVATSPTGTVQFYDSVGGAAAVPIGAPQPLNVGNGSSILATLAPVLSAGVNTVTTVYSGDANWTPATSGAVVITVTTPDFTASATPNPLTVSAGQAATIAISSQSILGFSSPISVSCGALPPGMTCNTATITPGAAGSITLSTTAPGTMMAKASFGPRLAFGVTGTLSLAGLLFFAFPRRRRRLYALSMLAIVGLGAAMTGSLIGCGGSSPATATSLCRYVGQHQGRFRLSSNAASDGDLRK